MSAQPLTPEEWAVVREFLVKRGKDKRLVATLDAARARIAELEKALDAMLPVEELRVLRAEVARLTAENKVLREGTAYSEYEAEIARMRPVVEAAMALKETDDSTLENPKFTALSWHRLNHECAEYEAGEQPDPYKGVDPRGGKRYGEGV
jgi:uncharacterized protein YhaN